MSYARYNILSCSQEKHDHCANSEIKKTKSMSPTKKCYQAHMAKQKTRDQMTLSPPMRMGGVYSNVEILRFEYTPASIIVIV
jgi:hypothetical protein